MRGTRSAPRSPSRAEGAIGALHAPMLGRSAELERLRALAAAAGSRPPRARRRAARGGEDPAAGRVRGLGGDAAVLRARVRPDGEPLRARRAAAWRPRSPEPTATRARLELSRPARRGGAVVVPAPPLGDRRATVPPSGTPASTRGSTALDALAPAGRALAGRGRALGRAATCSPFSTRRPAGRGTAGSWSRPRGRSCSGLPPRGATARAVDLAPLPAAEHRELVGALLGGALPEELVGRSRSAPTATPLFIEELLRTWASVGTLVRAGDAWRLRASGRGGAAAAPCRRSTPPSSTTCRRTLASSARRARWPAVASRSRRSSALGVEDADGESRRRSSVARSSPGPIRTRCSARLRVPPRAAPRRRLRILARAERADLHVRLARWLEGLGGALAEVIGAPLRGGGRECAPPRAGGCARRHARRGRGGRGALVRGRRWEGSRARRAPDRSRAAHAGARRFGDAAGIDAARRRRLLGEVLAEGGDMDEARAELEQARELAAPPPGDEDGRSEYAAATAALGRVANQQVRFAEAEQLAEDALAFLGEREDARRRSSCSCAAWATEWAPTRSRSPRATPSARSSSRSVPVTPTSSWMRACSAPRSSWIPPGRSRTSRRCGRSGASGAAG